MLFLFDGHEGCFVGCCRQTCRASKTVQDGRQASSRGQQSFRRTDTVYPPVWMSSILLWHLLLYMSYVFIGNQTNRKPRFQRSGVLIGCLIWEDNARNTRTAMSSKGARQLNHRGGDHRYGLCVSWILTANQLGSSCLAIGSNDPQQ